MDRIRKGKISRDKILSKHRIVVLVPFLSPKIANRYTLDSASIACPN